MQDGKKPSRMHEDGKLAASACRHGVFAYYTSDMIGRILDYYGEWDELEVSFLTSLLQPGDSVVDVGAHIGTYSIPLSRRVGESGMVFSFEPQRLVYYLLCANISLNQIRNIRALNMACGNEAGFVTIDEPPLERQRNFGAFRIAANVTQQPSFRATPIVRGDAVLAGLDNIRLLKVDVEGMELPVLYGFEQTIRVHRPIIHVEVNRETVFDEVKAFCGDRGYTMYWSLLSHYNPQNHYGRPSTFDRALCDVNACCFPDTSDLAHVPKHLIEANTFEELRKLNPKVYEICRSLEKRRSR